MSETLTIKPKVKKSKQKPKTRKKLTPDEKEQNELRKTIKNIFSNCGFETLNVNGIEFSIGEREKNELDHCFIYKNIIILVEDTISTRHEHIQTKQQTAELIMKHKFDFLSLMNSKFKYDTSKYPNARWKIFYLYACSKKLGLSDSDISRFKPLRFIEPANLNYFLSMSSILKKSFIYEFFRYLGISNQEIGTISDPSTTKCKVPIVYPTGITGLNNGVNIVSFMISADYLIRNGYVLRKDNWEESSGLYQRLITKNRIEKIREFVINNERTFFNNIIVSLPKNVKIYDQNDEIINLQDLDSFKNCTLELPDEFNSIGIIDGQHRIYSYYENNVLDNKEVKVNDLRNRIYLLVTGLIFPNTWTSSQRREFESNVFVEINKNSKNVDKDVLLHIESTQNPFSKNSIARRILEKLNLSGVFKDKFQLSLVETGQIKVASIIQFALSYLVASDISSNGLYQCWKNENSDIVIPDVLDNSIEECEELLNEYIKYCTSKISLYFSAIKQVYSDEWENPNSKILKVFSLNAFIIALHKSLGKTGGVKDFEFYKSIFSKKKFNFEKLEYAGSQYNMFAREQILPLFEQDDEYFVVSK